MIALALAAAIGSSSELDIEVVRKLSYVKSDHRVQLKRIRGTTPVFFQSKMSCDVDGAPNAYHPIDDRLALDVIDSAGGHRRNGLPDGPLDTMPSPEVVVFAGGKPYIQPDGKFKGFYVSETSYEDKSLPATSNMRYLDARTFRYIVLPGGLVPEAELGDLAIVVDPASRRYTTAVFGDIGPSSESGEVSLATILGLKLPATDGKSSPGQTRDDLLYIVFPHTAAKVAAADAWPHSVDTIAKLAAKEFEAWGGIRRVELILAENGQGGSLSPQPPVTGLYDELKALKDDGLAGADVAYDLPGSVRQPRLPCATEVASVAHQAATAIQSRIGAAERGQPLIPPLPRLMRHLSELAKIFAAFPDETAAEGDGELKEQTRLVDLVERLKQLKPTR